MATHRRVDPRPIRRSAGPPALRRSAGGIVTPEAVLLEFETAGVASRGVARLLDLAAQFMLLAMVLSVVTNGLVLVGQRGSPLVVAAAIVGVFIVLFGYPVGMEALWNGHTVGKAALGLRVVTDQGAPVRFRHTAIRGIVGFVEVLLLPFVAILSTAVSPANQRVGDLAAGTIVIRERSGGSRVVAVTFPPPPGLEGYARGLDVSAMTGAQYRVVRSFLIRAFTLAPDARHRVSLVLANPLAAALRHEPPPGVGPELFLVCAASAYQVRHAEPVAPGPAGVNSLW